MFKWLLPLLLLSTAAEAQTCPTRPAGDKSNACASTAFVNTPTTGGSFSPNLPVIGGLSGGLAQGTSSGSTTEFGTVNGALTNGHCVSIDSSGNFVDAGGACSIGGGGGTVTAGTAGQIAYYPASTNSVSGANLGPSLTLSGTTLNTTPTVQQNLLPNTQWQIMSNLGEITKPTSTGSGVVSAIAGNVAVSTTTLATYTTTNTQGLVSGDLVGCTGPGNMTFASMRVQSVVVNTSFTVYAPYQLPSGTGAGNCTAVTVGNYGTSGFGPDGGWTKTSTLSLWRDNYPANVKGGSKYSLGLKKGAGTAEDITYSVPANQLQQYLGRTLVFGAGVNQIVQGGTGTWKLCINDGAAACSSNGTGVGAGAFQWLETTKTISTSATSVTVYLETDGALNDVYYLTQPELAFGAYLGSWNYIQPRGEHIWFNNHINDPTLVGWAYSFPSSVWSGTPNYGYEIDMFAGTTGQIADTVVSVDTQGEWTTPTPLYNVEFGNNIFSSSASIFNLELRTQVSGKIISGNGTIPLDTNGIYISGQSGWFAMYSGYSGANPTNLTVDYIGATLNQ